jgi:RNA polymerase sigma-70 factor (ECF subfamily)
VTAYNEPEPAAARQTRELTGLRGGERGAAELFVRNHAGWMLAVANRIVRDAGHADDVVQNAFAAIFQNLQTFDERSALRIWMHRIVVNEALMLLRKRRRLREDPIDPLLPVFDNNGCRVEDDRTTIQNPETIMQQSQSAARVTELIGTLPDKFRIVLLLRDIEELSTAEVAEMLDLSEANVKVRLHRARAALKKLLEPLIKGQAL